MVTVLAMGVAILGDKVPGSRTPRHPSKTKAVYASDGLFQPRLSTRTTSIAIVPSKYTMRFRRHFRVSFDRPTNRMSILNRCVLRALYEFQFRRGHPAIGTLDQR